jgi:integrase
MKAEITDVFLDRRPFRTGNRLHISDSKLPGFYATIGGKTKTLTFRHRGIELARWRWPCITATEARQQAIDLLRRSLAGETITKTGRRDTDDKPTAPTLEQTLAAYLDAKGEKLRDRTGKDYRRILQEQAVDWLPSPIATITPDRFLDRYQGIKSPSRAHYLLRVVRALVRFHNHLNGDALPDPTAKATAVVGNRSPAPRSRHVSTDKLPDLFQAIEAHQDRDAAELLLLLALTGLRREEGRQLTWEEIDLQAGAIHLGGARTKNGRPHTLPLGYHLLERLQARYNAAEQPAEGNVFTCKLSAVRSAYEAIGKTLSYPFSPHDLRRTFATLAQKISGDELLTKALLNHAPQGVTARHYIQPDQERMREVMEAVEEHVFSTRKKE